MQGVGGTKPRGPIHRPQTTQHQPRPTDGGGTQGGGTQASQGAGELGKRPHAEAHGKQPAGHAAGKR